MWERIKDFFKELLSTVLLCLFLFCWLMLIGCLMTTFSNPGSVIYVIGMIFIHAPFVLALIWAVLAWLSPDKPSFEKNGRWKDEESYLWDVYEKICEKCRYGEDIDKLTEKERVIYVTQYLAAEVHNGGFDQFYSNSSGDFANEVIKALKTLGAERVLSICQKANAIFGESVPTDRHERNIFLTEKITSEQEEILEKCDEEFYEAYGELSELSYRYLKEYEEKMSEATDQMSD